MRKLFTVLLLGFGLGVTLVAQPTPAELSFGPDTEIKGDQLDTIVAVVDDDIITRSELDAALVAVERQLSLKKAPLPPQNVLENQVLERLIRGKLQVRAAERNGVVVDDQTLNAAIENLARQNNMTLSELRQTIERDGFDFANFRDEIRREIMATRLRQRVVDSQIQISEQEVDNFINSGGAAASSEYHIAQILIALPDGASPQQIEAGHAKALRVLAELRQGADFKRLAMSTSDDQRALEGGDLGWRRLDQMPTLFAEAVPRLQPGEVSEPIRSPRGFHLIKLLEVKGSQGRTVNQARLRHILIAANERLTDEEARLRLQRLYERIQNGADFAELARANSSDPASAVRGGEMGWVSPGDLPPAFQQEIEKLQPGQLSQPFKSPLGWHIVQVLERRQRDVNDATQRAQAREALFRRRAEEEWELWLRRLRDEAYVEIRLSQPPAQQEGLTQRP